MKKPESYPEPKTEKYPAEPSLEQSTRLLVECHNLLVLEDEELDGLAALDIQMVAWQWTQELRRTLHGEGPSRNQTTAEHHFASSMEAMQIAVSTIYAAAVEESPARDRNDWERDLAGHGRSPENWLAEKARELTDQLAKTALRREHVYRHGFPVVTGAAIDWMRSQTGAPPLLEIGAGNGYLAMEMNSRGATVHPTDPHPVWDAAGHRVDMAPVNGMEIENCDGLTALQRYPEHNILWSWPDENGAYTAEVLRACEGRNLVYIGEPQGGATGTAEFHEILNTRWKPNGKFQIPTFPLLNDQIVIYIPR